MPVSLIVICNTRLLRDGFGLLIADHPVLKLVGMADTCNDARLMAREQQVDVALLEIASTESLENLRALTSQVPRVRVVAFGLPEAEDVILEYAEAGVTGFVTRDSTLEETATIVQAALQDELLCSQRTAGALLRRVRVLANHRDDEDSMASLTPRELNLLDLIEQGMSNKDIARALDIGLSTVKNHVHNILEKLNVRRRGEAAALAHRKRRQTEGRTDAIEKYARPTRSGGRRASAGFSRPD